MGHGASKPEPEMELRPGMKPIWLKIEEVKRQRRVRKSSIVSTAELLCPEEREGIVDDDSARGATAPMAEKEEEGAGSPEIIANAEEEKLKEEKRINKEEKVATEAAAADEEEEERELAFRGAEEDEDEDEKGRKLGSSTAYADQPGSPSFRFYCTDLARDSEEDTSVKFGGARRKGKLPETKEKEKVAHEREDSTGSANSNEYSEIKPLKKDRGRTLKALSKAPGHVYNLLNIRNCYSNPSSTANQDTASLL
ncbi:eukaryotic translation initiation factor 5B-like [Phoenix dactylifera]|uniref:Eukaryotic translation initiation factor 5B-like n=1 Tax=Phoenix dactylifera TaxID=42345 RepID=A0A8B9AF67_PHODC|nr:eukaryotic translation initiation factor 5B-like [Phoenix dactylifera]